MSARPSRGGGSKRSYADDAGSESEHSEESVPKPKLNQSRRSNKRQKAVEKSDDEDGCEVAEGDTGGDMDVDDGTGRSTVYEAGQIVRVYVENFMCHRKFHFDLGRHLNFITGRNGSGKSAIAAAIQLCLGSSARHTGRGSNLAKYIREGSEDPAVLEVTLLNEGPDAYKPEDYGRKIIVRRVISKTGSTYQLLSEHKKEVCRLRSELDKILKDFNIYVDTPCCILTQEESKRLIHGSAREKYEFFIKATGLKHLHEELTVGESDVAECEENMARAKPQVLQLKSDFEQAKAKAQEFKQLDEIEGNIRLTTAKLFWDEVRTIEGSIDTLKGELAKRRDRLEEAQTNYDAVAVSDGAAKDAQLKVLRTAINTSSAEIEELKAQIEAKKKEVYALGKNLSANKRSLGEHEANRAAHLARAKEADAELKTMRDRAMQDAGKQEKEALDLLAACEEETQQVKSALQDMDTHRKNVVEQVAGMQKELKRVGEASNYHFKRIDGAKKELQDARRGRDRAAKFGPRVTDLLVRINRDRHLFQGPVVGPIGARVTIREGCEKWATALECALSSIMKSFIVTTTSDRARLFQMMKSLDMQRFHAIVLQASGPRFPTDYPAMAGALNMLDALVIEDDLVFNCLLDQVSIDRVGLVEKEATITSQFVEQVNGVDRLTYGLSRILSMDAVTVSYKMGNEESAVCRIQITNCLSADETSYIANLEQSIGASQQELQGAQQEQTVLNQRITAANAEIRNVTDALQKAHQKVRALGKRKQDLDARYLEVQDLGRVDTTELEGEAETLRMNLEAIAFDIEQTNVGVRSLEADLKVHKTEQNHLDKARSELEVLAERQMKELNDFTNLCNSNEKRVEGLKRNLAVKKTALEEFVANVYDKETAAFDEKLREAQDNTANLVEHWDGAPLPLEEKETKAFLDKQIKRLQAQLDEGKRKANLEGYTTAILLERMETAKAAYDLKKQEFQLIRDNRNVMYDLVKDKQQQWDASFKKTVRLIQKAFDVYAQKQGATGTVEICPEKQEMMLIVQMDANDKKTLATDVKNLSGGERSYTTLCLLLALGHVTESPFRIMDEYDVFMDEGRRNDTLRSIQQHSQRADQFGRQIIVITPNTLASVKNGNTDKVRIHKMPDPVKQAAHGLQQQTL